MCIALMIVTLTLMQLTAELEETVLALKQRVNQLEESKQQEQIQQLCENSASDSQFVAIARTY